MDKELIERLAREALTYEPETGLFRRRSNGLRTKANLRQSTPVQNQWNARPRANTSGHKDVSKHRAGWQARIRVNKRIVHLGTYETPDRAALAYNEAARMVAGEFAYANRDLAAAIRAKFAPPG